MGFSVAFTAAEKKCEVLAWGIYLFHGLSLLFPPFVYLNAFPLSLVVLAFLNWLVSLACLAFSGLFLPSRLSRFSVPALLSDLAKY